MGATEIGSRRKHGPRWARLAPRIVAVALLCGSCTTVPLVSKNLDALLDSGDNLRHVAPVQSSWRYHLAGLVDPKWLKGDSFLGEPEDVQIGDPSYEVLKYLLKLEDPPGGTTRPEYQRMEQVRQFARFAARCPGKLVRERALLALVPHGQRLGVVGPAQDPEQAANAPELQSALTGLMQAAEPLLRANARADETRVQDLRAAALVMGELELDLDGGWRALKAISALAGATDITAEEFEPVLVLARNQQRRLIGLALASGLRDRDPYVRAAAAKANYGIAGEPFLVDLLRSTMGAGGEYESPFGLVPENPADPEVFLAAYEMVREFGLPSTPTLDPIEARVERVELLRGILSVATETELFADRPRTAAMLALGAVVPDGPGTLRKEDWTDWWQEWAPRVMTEVDAERKLRGDVTP